MRDLIAALLTVALWAGDDSATEDWIFKAYCTFRVRLRDLHELENETPPPGEPGEGVVSAGEAPS